MNVTGTATGGSGGNAAFGPGAGGGGASTFLSNNLDGDASSTSTVNLHQTAIGGAGGSALSGAAGDGGSASSVLSRSKNVGTLLVDAQATGGAAGEKYDAGGPATGATGGAAVATSIADNSAFTAAGEPRRAARGAAADMGPPAVPAARQSQMPLAAIAAGSRS